MTIPPQLQPDYREVNRGRDIICSIRELYTLDETVCWVLLPEENEELNRLATGCILLDYMENKGCPRAVILSPDRGQNSPHSVWQRGREILSLALEAEDFAAVLSYCRLVAFASHLIIVSLREPYSFSAWIGHFGITLERFVRDALFFGSPINWLWWVTDVQAIARAIDIQSGKLRGKRLYLYGWTRDAQTILRVLEEKGFTLSGLLDSDPEKDIALPGTDIRSRLPEEALRPYDPQASVIIVSKYARDMRSRLEALGYGSEQTVEVPVSGGICAVKGTSRETLDDEFRKVIEGVRLREGAGPGEMVACQSGTGDVYYACALLPGYLRAKGLPRCTLAIPANRSCIRVAELFGFPKADLRTYSVGELTTMYKAWELLGGERMKLRPVLNLGSRLPKRLVPRAGADDSPAWYHWLNCMRYQYFAVPGVRALTPPHQRSCQETAEHCRRMGLRQGRTVLLSPYANAYSPNLSARTDFWPRLAEQLKSLGYDVLTNCSEGEAPVPGTDGYCVPYEELIPFLNYSGYFVAARSGLCDIAGTARDCRMVLLYEAGTGIRPEMWSLKKMGIHPRCTDLRFTGDADLLLAQTIRAITGPEDPEKCCRPHPSGPVSPGQGGLSTEAKIKGRPVND